MSFQVATDVAKSNRIVSVGPLPDHTFSPGSNFGPNYPIHTIEDDTLYSEAVITPSYLCADGTIKREPCP